MRLIKLIIKFVRSCFFRAPAPKNPVSIRSKDYQLWSSVKDGQSWQWVVNLKTKQAVLGISRAGLDVVEFIVGIGQEFVALGIIAELSAKVDKTFTVYYADLAVDFISKTITINGGDSLLNKSSKEDKPEFYN